MYHNDNQELRVTTPEGILVARPSTDESHPGISIDLRSPKSPAELGIAHVEWDPTENTFTTRTWGDASQEDPTHVERHANVRKWIDEEDTTPPVRIDSPVAYICSPYKGRDMAERQDNIGAAKRYGRFALSQGRVPYIAHLAVCGFLDDDIPSERDAGIMVDSAMITKACDELWVFGDKLSPGMKAEIALFRKLGRPIKYFTDGCSERTPEDTGRLLREQDA